MTDDEMYYLSVFNEKYLLKAIKDSGQVEMLDLALNKFDNGYIDEAHSICDELQEKTALALVLSALFSRKDESEDEFKVRHIRYLKKAAIEGESLAQYALGRYFEEGNMLKENKQEAERYYKLAAESGMPLACHTYGVMLYYAYNTESVLVDKVKALELLNYASDCGVEEAIEFLNFLNSDGKK